MASVDHFLGRLGLSQAYALVNRTVNTEKKGVGW